MEKSGGLSTVLNQRIADTKVAIVGCMAVEHIAEAIRRLGFVDIVSIPDCTNLPVCKAIDAITLTKSTPPPPAFLMTPLIKHCAYICSA